MYGCDHSSRLLVNGNGDLQACAAVVGDEISVSMEILFGQRTLDIGTQKGQNGSDYWYQFKFPAIGIEHTSLAVFFMGAPNFMQVYRWNNTYWESCGGIVFLDTVDLNTVYGMWIRTSTGWTKDYNAKGRFSAYWSLTKPIGGTVSIGSSYYDYQTGATVRPFVFVELAKEGTYTIEDSFVQFIDGGVCY